MYRLPSPAVLGGVCDKCLAAGLCFFFNVDVVPSFSQKNYSLVRYVLKQQARITTSSACGIFFHYFVGSYFLLVYFVRIKYLVYLICQKKKYLNSILKRVAADAFIEKKLNVVISGSKVNLYSIKAPVAMTFYQALRVTLKSKRYINWYLLLIVRSPNWFQ